VKTIITILVLVLCFMTAFDNGGQIYPLAVFCLFAHIVYHVDINKFIRYTHKSSKDNAKLVERFPDTTMAIILFVCIIIGGWVLLSSS